jgi:uncharacterized protein (TIGR03067 family)
LSVVLALAVLGAAGLLTYGTLSAQGPGAQRGASDHEKLQGTWALVSEERGGRQVEPAEAKGATLTFEGERAILKHGGLSQEARFKLDPTRTPKEFDLTTDEEDGKAKVHMGLYALEGDTLRLCISHPPHPRPTAFASVAGAQWPAVFVFKRK